MGSIFNWCAIALVVITIIVVVCFYKIKSVDEIAMYYVYMSSYTIVTIAYLWTMFYLKLSFDKMDMSNLKNEKRSVHYQFIVFQLAFVTRATYYFVEAYTD